MMFEDVLDMFLDVRSHSKHFSHLPAMNIQPQFELVNSPRSDETPVPEIYSLTDG